MDMTELKPHLDALTKAATAKSDEAVERMNLMRTQIEDLQQKADRRGGRQPTHADALQDVLQKSAAFQALRERNTTTCRLELPRSLLTKAAMTSATHGEAGQAMRLPNIAAPAQRGFTLRELLPTLPTQAGSIEYVKETGFTNGAAAVAEAALKPESSVAIDLQTAKIATIAHWAHASVQVLSDAPMLQAFIETRLRYGLQLAEELQILAGTGVGANMLGLIAQATAYVAPVTYTTPNRIDVLRLAQGQLENANYLSTGIVMHPNDWLRIDLLKDAESRYLRAFPTDGTERRIWGTRVVTTTAMPSGQFLIGDFDQAAILFDRQLATLDIAYQDSDDFVKNLCKLRVESRTGLAVQLPDALVIGAFPA